VSVRALAFGIGIVVTCPGGGFVWSLESDQHAPDHMQSPARCQSRRVRKGMQRAHREGEQARIASNAIALRGAPA
jgi:hypothetical protein